MRDASVTGEVLRGGQDTSVPQPAHERGAYAGDLLAIRTEMLGPPLIGFLAGYLSLPVALAAFPC